MRSGARNIMVPTKVLENSCVLVSCFTSPKSEIFTANQQMTRGEMSAARAPERMLAAKRQAAVQHALRTNQRRRIQRRRRERVENRTSSVAVDEHVGRFDVAVHLAVVVHVLQTLQQLQKEAHKEGEPRRAKFKEARSSAWRQTLDAARNHRSHARHGTQRTRQVHSNKAATTHLFGDDANHVLVQRTVRFHGLIQRALVHVLCIRKRQLRRT